MYNRYNRFKKYHASPYDYDDNGNEVHTTFRGFNNGRGQDGDNTDYNNGKGGYNHNLNQYDDIEPEMVDTTYAEHYGELYTNKPIRYIYPEGYASMRPRSRPWQIALGLCALFAWLNVFIIGHCSDRFDWEGYYNNKNNGDDDANGNGNYYGDDDANKNYNNNMNFDDDAMKIETGWCGSRPLYMLWVGSVVLTGLSCAYCSIIGYVKARDFAVANGRSQPPGMMGKSDYYVQIEEELLVEGNRRFTKTRNTGGSGTYNSYQQAEEGVAQRSHLKKTIYQSDGTPRFFGGQIYKPTQAAVNLTSR